MAYMNWRRGVSDRKLGNGDVVKLRLGGVVTGSSSQKLTGDVDELEGFQPDSSNSQEDLQDIVTQNQF